MSPLDPDKSTQDIFKNEYLELVYHFQTAVEQGFVEFEGNNYNIDDFCFKPITGEGCLIPSAMDFWKMDLAEMKKDKDVKFTA